MADKHADSLKLIRFCGEEYYPIVKAVWFIVEGEEFDKLCFEIDAARGVVLSDDTKELKAKPNWELTYISKTLNKNDLKNGFKAEIPDSYDENIDDFVTNFYYCEHQETDNNLIEILKTNGEKIYARITGETTDVNYYDGSKPKNKIIVETWFEYMKTIKA
jgi:hypothetical protein